MIKTSDKYERNHIPKLISLRSWPNYETNAVGVDMIKLNVLVDYEKQIFWMNTLRQISNSDIQSQRQREV